MGELFRAKVRMVGTSMGVLIPKELAEKEHIKIGEDVQIALLKENRRWLIDGLSGIAKGAKPFVREKTDRVDRY